MSTDHDHATDLPQWRTVCADPLADGEVLAWAELTAMIAARTMGVPIHRPVAADGRSAEVQPGFDLDSIEYPSDGSGLVIWDSGSDPIPFANVPPSTGRDSHEDPRADADVRAQKASFLFDDTLVDVCGGEACTADARD